jgi:hypothetical protein
VCVVCGWEAIASALSYAGLSYAGPGLVGHHADHKKDIEAEEPEEKFLGSGEAAARQMMMLFGGNELIRFERFDHKGEIFAADFCDWGGIETWFHLVASDERQSVRSRHADAEQNAGRDQDHHHGEREDVGPAGTDQISHDFAVVDQHVQEEQGGRHG